MRTAPNTLLGEGLREQTGMRKTWKESLSVITSPSVKTSLQQSRRENWDGVEVMEKVRLELGSEVIDENWDWMEKPQRADKELKLVVMFLLMGLRYSLTWGLLWSLWPSLEDGPWRTQVQGRSTPATCLLSVFLLLGAWLCCTGQ